MLGLDFRDTDDVVNDLIKVGNIASKYKDYKDKLQTLVTLYGIESMTECECRDFRKDLNFQERLHCPKCNGVGYIIKYKEK